MAPPFLVIGGFLVLFPTAQSIHAGTSVYLSHLIELSRKKNLHNHKYWHTLIHYKSGVLGLRSLVDDPDFFLSKRGKVDPQAELEATIEALFRQGEDTQTHPACKFIARFTWIKDMLGIDTSCLPLAGCKRFEEFIAQIKPESASLVFPASYMSNPASMFGHTLLTIDTTEKSKLLSYAINYSAVTQESFGPIFAIKGIFGLYDGYYSMLPYYQKLKEYSNVNHRDIWEYPLNLDTEEVKRLLMHASELDFIASDYFFFDENCSYNLLFLLDAARPSLNLTDRVGWWITPLDTIVAAKKADLIEEIVYRPSKTTKVKHMVSLLSECGRQWAWSIAQGKVHPNVVLEESFTKKQRALILDTASEYIEYLYTKRSVSKKIYVKRFRAILGVRSLLVTEDDEYEVPAPTPPDRGHGPARISFGLGIRDDTAFQEIRFRPVYHEFLDSSKGYLENSEIVFGQTILRHYSLERSSKLEAFDFIELGSFVPRDRFFQPPSWKVYTGLQRKILKDGREHLVYRLNPGLGLSYKVKRIGICHALVETDINVGGALENGWALGVGGSFGIMKQLARNWKFSGIGTYLHYSSGEKHNFWKAAVQQSFILCRNKSLQADFIRRKSHDFYETEFKVCLNVYF